MTTCKRNQDRQRALARAYSDVGYLIRDQLHAKNFDIASFVPSLKPKYDWQRKLTPKAKQTAKVKPVKVKRPARKAKRR